MKGYVVGDPSLASVHIKTEGLNSLCIPLEDYWSYVLLCAGINCCQCLGLGLLFFSLRNLQHKCKSKAFGSLCHKANRVVVLFTLHL